MEQRRLRPGDTLDDYCPRERRLTDHVVVAVVDDLVKQTRCVACDAEHPYKEGRVPPRRRKPEAPPALVQPALEVLAEEQPSGDNGQPAGLPNLVLRPERKPAKGRRAPAPADPPEAPEPALDPALTPDEAPPVLAAPGEEEDEGPVHRRLIRATLPRPEGQPPARPIPEFTMRQPGTRGGFGRSGQAGRAGKGANRQGTPWLVRQNGHGNRAGISAQGPGADGRARNKAGRSRGGRHHKKSR
jgi:hypothetical protein